MCVREVKLVRENKTEKFVNLSYFFAKLIAIKSQEIRKSIIKIKGKGMAKKHQ